MKMVELPSLKEHIFANSQPIYSIHNRLSGSTEELPNRLMKGWQAYRSFTKNLAEKVIEANLKREQDKEKEPKEDLIPKKVEDPVE